MQTIKIIVEGGTIQSVDNIPPGVEVQVKDFDCDEPNHTAAEMDEDSGALCYHSLWEHVPEGMIELDERFWDCECKHNYIHPKQITYCPHCHTHPDDQPDSRKNEVNHSWIICPNCLEIGFFGYYDSESLVDCVEHKPHNTIGLYCNIKR